MAPILVIADWYPIYDNRGIPTGEKEYVASHGIDENTGKSVILQCIHPRDLGAKMVPGVGWVLHDKE